MGDHSWNAWENRNKYGWWGFGDGPEIQDKAMAAARIIKQHEGYIVNSKEWCVGWSDIYYVPRIDYVFLSSIFRALYTFHEVAVPDNDSYH